MGVCKQFAAVAVAIGLAGAAHADTPAAGCRIS